ncbi:hypothetical protein [Marispirochaeta aestuarii]|uniref:hypothetical protein n=1 Tax=Marispirochaeta aestuarii TaxID=1963862 RepID=UPI0029C9265D|nr:hypothetical protein [Marispirochaeta aestuarii]
MRDDVKTFLTEEIRKASQEGRLTDNRELAAAGSRFFNTEFTPDMIAARVESAARIESPDIHIFQGKECYRYYSSLSMADSFAETLNISAEGNEMELVAATVRRESRVYPRPTRLNLFLEFPFSIEVAQLEQLAKALVQNSKDYADIQLARASNGDRYLFSTKFLETPQADYLAEWESVGILESQ